MLEKIIYIKNIGRFRNCSPVGDVTFRKLTLVYADNGRGKTTLCAILRSLKHGNPKLIAERHMLGTKDAPSVHLRLGGKQFTFSKNSWNETASILEVFDSTFVHENVYTGDHIDHEHKKSLYRVLIGAKGVTLATKVDTLTDSIKLKTTEIATLKTALTKVVPEGVTIEQYVAWVPRTDIDKEIADKKAKLTASQFAASKSTEIAAKPLLELVTLPSLPEDFEVILGKKLEDVVEGAETRVRAQIEKHNMHEEGEAWLGKGLEFVTADACPFCDQKINGLQIIAAYRSHFNEIYNDLKAQVETLGKSINDSVGADSLAAVHTILANNAAAVEFWKNLVTFEFQDLNYVSIQTSYSKLRDTAAALALAKQLNPAKSVISDAALETARLEIGVSQELVSKYNAMVTAANGLILEQKKMKPVGLDVLQKELRILEARKSRFDAAQVKSCKEYTDASKEKNRLEGEKQQAKDALDAYCLSTLVNYESAINYYLDQFNAGFRISNTKHDYVGASPRCYFQISINDTAIAVGDAKTAEGTHSFKTALSAGDRSALALAFFVAALRNDPEIAAKIVVLDDPFNSQDRFRRTCTQQLIGSLARDAKQVVVLSHDPIFLQLVADGYNPPGDVKTLQLSLTGNSTMVGVLDLAEETQSTYMKDFSRLHQFYCDRTGDHMTVARSIRPFLEGMLRCHFPGHFSQGWLGDFLDKIRQAVGGDGLAHLHPDLDELVAINDYSKKYHHQQNSNADNEPISPDELHGYVKRTLRLVGGA